MNASLFNRASSLRPPKYPLIVEIRRDLKNVFKVQLFIISFMFWLVDPRLKRPGMMRLRNFRSFVFDLDQLMHKKQVLQISFD